MTTKPKRQRRYWTLDDELTVHVLKTDVRELKDALSARCVCTFLAEKPEPKDLTEKWAELECNYHMKMRTALPDQAKIESERRQSGLKDLRIQVLLESSKDLESRLAAKETLPHPDVVESIKAVVNNEAVEGPYGYYCLWCFKASALGPVRIEHTADCVWKRVKESSVIQRILEEAAEQEKGAA